MFRCCESLQVQAQILKLLLYRYVQVLRVTAGPIPDPQTAPLQVGSSAASHCRPRSRSSNCSSTGRLRCCESLQAQAQILKLLLYRYVQVLRVTAGPGPDPQTAPLQVGSDAASHCRPNPRSSNCSSTGRFRCCESLQAQILKLLLYR